MLANSWLHKTLGSLSYSFSIFSKMDCGCVTGRPGVKFELVWSEERQVSRAHNELE